MTPLERLIRAEIERTGPIPVESYMALALGHAEHGYYIRQNPLGADGDFITAPEISQTFGELIGLWAAVVWQQMGCPPRTALVECGPGRGTLMADALRAAATAPEFLETIELHLVETSPALREHQRASLSGQTPSWHETIDTLPDLPTIMIANEFFDALPVRQLVRTGCGWSERCVAASSDSLSFVPGIPVPEADLPRALALAPGAAPGDIAEIPAAGCSIARQCGAHIARHGGAALIIDYGHIESAVGDTLQAVQRHGFADPLTDPGEADLTAHVDFEAIGAAFRDGGAAVHGPLTQRAFLMALGILQRTERLVRDAPADSASRILSATNRLIDPGEMGTLFKVMAATGADAPPPAGFENCKAPDDKVTRC